MQVSLSLLKCLTTLGQSELLPAETALPQAPYRIRSYHRGKSIGEVGRKLAPAQASRLRPARPRRYPRAGPGRLLSLSDQQVLLDAVLQQERAVDAEALEETGHFRGDEARRGALGGG